MRKWVNLYYSVAKNKTVCGLTFWDTEEEARKNQNCPAGYYFLTSIQQRNF